MKKTIYSLLCAFVISLPAFAFFAGNWKIKDPGYEVKFTGGRINGTFEGLKADILFDKAHPELAKISASIDVNTISTGFFLKTNHAKDALGAEQYPTIRFVSTTVTKTASGYDAAGKLTLKGVTQPETIHFTFDDKGNEGLFKGDFKIIPKDFKIDRNGTPEQVVINLTVPVTK